MIRIFGILSTLAALMIFISGGGIYWISQSNISQAKQYAAESVAKGLTLSITSKIQTLQSSVTKMAAAPEVIAAIENGDPRQLSLMATNLEQFLPSVMKIRVLPINVSELDESVTPHMGNADLIMAQETLTAPQTPVIQGQGKHRHLAITAVVKKGDRAVGIILASLKYNFLQSSLNQAKITQGFYELKQGNALLAKTGNPSDKVDASESFKVSKTLWSIAYWPDNTSDYATLSILATIVLIPVLLICLAFFVSYRKISTILIQDQASILKAVKDLMSGKTVGSYPVNLTEMKAVISTLIQFKRVLDNQGGDLSNEPEPADSDGFFDDLDGVSFLDADLDILDQESPTIDTSNTSSISLPITENKNKDSTPSHSFTETNQALSTKQGSSSSIYKAYDIRGIAGKSLTKDTVFDIGRAIGSEAKSKSIKTIVVGRDGRTTSESLSEAVTKGITSTGVNVLDISLVPSPIVYFVAQHTEGKSGVVITGSHNPAEYNGLKIIINGETLAGDKIKQLEHRIENVDFLTGETGSVDVNTMFTNEYIGIISEDIHIVRPMKIVIDCGNGAAGEIAPILFRTLGCEVIELFCDIDGTFPNHHPDPSKPENLTDLTVAVQHYDADVGIAFDGDGDRLGIVDCKGKIIWPDRLMMLFAKNVLAVKPGSDVIYDVKCSNHLNEQIVNSAGRPIMWKSGHSLIKQKIKETGAVLAGEMSGHIFFNDRWFGFDDALYSASRLIEILSADSRSSNEVFADFPESISTPEINIPLPEGESTNFMENLFNVASFPNGNIITIDGLRVEFEDGWGLVRASNTMPCLVLRFEADTLEAFERIQTQFKKLLTDVKPDISISF